MTSIGDVDRWSKESHLTSLSSLSASRTTVGELRRRKSSAVLTRRKRNKLKRNNKEKWNKKGHGTAKKDDLLGSASAERIGAQVPSGQSYPVDRPLFWTHVDQKNAF